MLLIIIVMHGPEATVELRKAGYTGAVIGVTGNVLQSDVDYFLKCGADAVLAKPLNIPKLVTVLLEVLLVYYIYITSLSQYTMALCRLKETLQALNFPTSADSGL